MYMNYRVDLVKHVRFVLLYKTSNLKKQNFLICLCFFYYIIDYTGVELGNRAFFVCTQQGLRYIIVSKVRSPLEVTPRTKKKKNPNNTQTDTYKDSSVLGWFHISDYTFSSLAQEGSVQYHDDILFLDVTYISSQNDR